MSAPARLALYGLALVAVFAGTFGIGRAVDPIGLSNAEPVEEHGGGMDEMGGAPGLAVAEGDLALVATTDTIPAGEPTRYEFEVRGPDGPVTEFELEQTKKMHLIAVRRDFVGFVHQHPTMTAAGTWSTTLTLPDPGTYRVYADFIVDGEKRTLGTDLFVPGVFEPRPLPEADAVAQLADGYAVELHADPVAGEESVLELTVSHNGVPVRELRDYLGAKGHLVALRDGDLAYLHVHPEEDRLVFEADFPTAGSYRLFLQLDLGGQIRTAPFTLDVKESAR